MFRCTKLGTLGDLLLLFEYNLPKNLSTRHLLVLICNESLEPCQASLKGPGCCSTPHQELRIKFLIRVHGLLHLYVNQMEKEDSVLYK